MTHSQNASPSKLSLSWIALGFFSMASWAQEPSSQGNPPVPEIADTPVQDPQPPKPPVVDPAPAPVAGDPAVGAPGARPQDPAPLEPTSRPAEQPSLPPAASPSTAIAPAGADGLRPTQSGESPAAALSTTPALVSVPKDLTQVAAALDKIVSEHPAIARTLELGKLTDGRKVPALLFGAEGALALEERPTILLLGGLDGEGPSGGVAVLEISAELLREPANLPAGVAFAAVPWASPEALELTLAGRSADGRNTRPVDEDRDGRFDEDGPDDLDGDGVILQMLVEDPEGPWIRPAGQRLLARAKPGDAPRYTLTLEGKDDDGDGLFNEDGPGGVVLDLNFPVGRTGPWVDNLAGVLPLSESLPRTYADFALARRAAIVILFQGNYGRLAIPGGSKSTTTAGWMPDADRSVFERVNASFNAATARRGTPAATLLECRGRERRGAAVDWFYSASGALAFELAPWGPGLDAPAEGGPENARFDSPKAETGRKTPDGVSAEDLAWLRWIDDTSGGLGFMDWHPVELVRGGQVLVGGWEPGARTTPPKEKLPRALQGLADFTRRLSSSLPRLELRIAEASRDGDVCRIRARIANAGVLPTGLAISDRRIDAVGAWLSLELPAEAKLIAGSGRCSLARLAGGGISRECEWVVVAPAGSTFSLRAGGDWALPVAKEVKP